MNSMISLNQHKVINSIKVLYWVGGSLIIIAAGLSLFTQLTFVELLQVINQHFGKTFSFFYLALVGIGTFALCKMWTQSSNTAMYSELGYQAASGISTLALTFTLFGISMGIGALSDRSLTPDNVDVVIAELTAQFSMAFMTTVLGLPSAAILRALIAVRQAAIAQQA